MTKQTQTKTAAVAIMETFTKNNTKIVAFDKPLMRGKLEIQEVELIEPTVNTLKGLRVLDVLQLDVDAYTTLLPRITNPALTPAEISQLSPADFISLCTECVSFFAKEKDQTAVMAA
ncbi:phage tail assembly protein [Actinobacillus delphinicola]|uniref:phage tail assembly protein n=1 Tax=Actinobacillus delphinicola TaxID=51161 RepID=UPI002442BDC4|nr:phage tail assembly protein [Actinobacillus delphinicola]